MINKACRLRYMEMNRLKFMDLMSKSSKKKITTSSLKLSSLNLPNYKKLFQLTFQTPHGLRLIQLVLFCKNLYASQTWSNNK